jgi:large subunit ribosomal protein L6
MSKVGKMPIKIPEGVTVNISGRQIKITGPKGERSFLLPPRVDVKEEGGQIVCRAKKNASALWGLTRTEIANAILGVTSGWSKSLELAGVGFRAEIAGDELILTIGFACPVRVKAPAGITFQVTENKIQVLGIDKQLVGEMAAKLRRLRPPEPYKGKGIKYLGEKIKRKVGKVAKAIGTAGGMGGK